MQQIRASRLLFFNLYRPLSHLPLASISNTPSISSPSNHPCLPFLPTTHFSSFPYRPPKGPKTRDHDTEDRFLRNLNYGDEGNDQRMERPRQNHPTQIPNRPLRGSRSPDGSRDLFPDVDDRREDWSRTRREPLLNPNFGDEGNELRIDRHRQNHPTQIPNRPSWGSRSPDGSRDLFPDVDDRREERSRSSRTPSLNLDFGDEDNEQSTKDTQIPKRPSRGSRSPDGSRDLFPDVKDWREERSRTHRGPPTRNPNIAMRGMRGDENLEASRNAPPKVASRSMRGEERNGGAPKIGDSINAGEDGNQFGTSLLRNLNFGEDRTDDKVEETSVNASTDITGAEPAVSESSVKDADEIFKKMKETGLIPNAVAMLDGLCKDGLVQEAMKLFGLMREKGSIPEIVVYTAVVDGFCKAEKFDDAKRVFRKMQKNGILPNAFSYAVLIQGLCRGRRLEDSFEFCKEMLDAGHSPNAMTFTGLIEGFCTEKGLEEAESVIKSLEERGFAVDEKAVREHLDKKGPFSPMIQEVVFKKKHSPRPS